jgi:hypothetical protein
MDEDGPYGDVYPTRNNMTPTRAPILLLTDKGFSPPQAAELQSPQ